MLAHMHPIQLQTVGGLLARDHTLGLYCHHCDRWTEAPLERLASEGWGRTPIIKLRFRCIVCGGPAQRQLRPPSGSKLLRDYTPRHANLRRGPESTPGGTNGLIVAETDRALNRGKGRTDRTIL